MRNIPPIPVRGGPTHVVYRRSRSLHACIQTPLLPRRTSRHASIFGDFRRRGDMHRLRAGPPALRCALRASGPGVEPPMEPRRPTTNRRGEPTAVNDRARALLRLGGGLRYEDGRLCVSLRGEDAALQALIARALPFPDGPGEGGTMPLGRPETRSRLVLPVTITDTGQDHQRHRGRERTEPHYLHVAHPAHLRRTRGLPPDRGDAACHAPGRPAAGAGLTRPGAAAPAPSSA